MCGVASILNPDRFAAVESIIADADRCGRSDNGLLVVPIRHEILIARWG
jgi:hypothetical protein